VFAEMLTSQPAFPGATEIDQIERIFKVCGSPTPESWPGFAKLPGAQRIKLKQTYPRTFRQRFEKYVKHLRIFWIFFCDVEAEFSRFFRRLICLLQVWR
jgi:hypothetical protein